MTRWVEHTAHQRLAVESGPFPPAIARTQRADDGGHQFPRVTVPQTADHELAHSSELLIGSRAANVIHSLAYEPTFEPSVASVHALHPREGAVVDALDRAA